MKKRFMSKHRISTSDPENVSLHSRRSFRYGDVPCCGSCSIEDRISSGLQSYVFGSLPRPPEFCSNLPMRCNFAGSVCQFLKSVSKHINFGFIFADACVAIWKFLECGGAFRETKILLEDFQHDEYETIDRLRFFVELFTLWCGYAHDLYIVSEDNFRHQFPFRQAANYKFVVVICCLYLCGDDCHGFLKLELLVNEFYVKWLMNYGGLQVMAPHGDSSLTDFHLSIIVVMVQPLSLFLKQEVCYLKVLISFAIESLMQIQVAGSVFLQPATSSFLSLIYRVFDSTVKIVIKLKNGESDFISSYDEFSSIAINRFEVEFVVARSVMDEDDVFSFAKKLAVPYNFVIQHLSVVQFANYVTIFAAPMLQFGCDGETGFDSSYDEFWSIAINRFHISALRFSLLRGRFLCLGSSMMIFLVVHHFVIVLVLPDWSDYLGCSAECSNRSIIMDEYPSFSGFAEFNTPPDVFFVEDRMLKEASWLQIDLVLGFQDVHVTTFDGLHIQGELRMVILEWLNHLSPFEVYECVRSLYKKEVKFSAHTPYRKSTVTETLFTNKDLSLLLHGDDSFIGQEYVDTSNRLSTFIFGSLTRPPELHCASVSSLQVEMGVSHFAMLWKTHL